MVTDGDHGRRRLAEQADFERFYSASYGRLVGQLFAVLGDLGEAEDAVQEAFARASVRRRAAPSTRSRGSCESRPGR
jgi:DNA-directed RNA polymerase specialized sigma24 family protein